MLILATRYHENLNFALLRMCECVRVNMIVCACVCVFGAYTIKSEIVHINTFNI